MAKKQITIVVPKNKWAVQTEKKPTKFLMTSDGHMAGRQNISKGKSDNTKVIRMTDNFDVNRDGKMDNRDLLSGQVAGRVSKGQNPSRIEVDSHYRKGGRRVKQYFRNK